MLTLPRDGRCIAGAAQWPRAYTYAVSWAAASGVGLKWPAGITIKDPSGDQASRRHKMLACSSRNRECQARRAGAADAAPASPAVR